MLFPIMPQSTLIGHSLAFYTTAWAISNHMVMDVITDMSFSPKLIFRRESLIPMYTAEKL